MQPLFTQIHHPRGGGFQTLLDCVTSSTVPANTCSGGDEATANLFSVFNVEIVFPIEL